MRYYIDTTEMKWTHQDHTEQLFVKMHIGEKLYDTINQPGHHMVLLRSSSQTLPSDIYKRVDVYVDIDDDKRAMMFALAFPKVQVV